MLNSVNVSISEESIDIAFIDINVDLFRTIPIELMNTVGILPISHNDGTLSVAVSNADNASDIDILRRYVEADTEILVFVSAKSGISQRLEQISKDILTVDAIVSEIKKNRDNPKQIESPIIKLIDTIIWDAVKDHSSDLHFEPEQSYVRVRSRIDGVLHQKYTIPFEHWSLIANRIKIFAGMDIADTMSIQEGRFDLKINDLSIDFRVAVMPTVSGENIVIRILHKNRDKFESLATLGFNQVALQEILQMCQRPEGIILVTGPTGSGKTTTIYSMMKQVSDISNNVMSLEDPVEYSMDLVRQISISEDKGIDFVNGVRGLLRQDPDVIFIGEIRDSETSIVGFRAAMTGHQVFSTLHCNDVFGALPRLNDLGVSRETISGNVIGIIAQRLVRKLCPYCKETRDATQQELQLIKKHCNIGKKTAVPIAFANGCSMCFSTGFSGRTVIAEVLRFSHKMDELVASKAVLSEIKKQAQEDGFAFMIKDGIEKVLALETTFDELKRVLDLTRSL